MPQHRDHEALVGVGREPEVVIALEHDLAARVVEACVERREPPERIHQRAQDVGEVGEPDPGALGAGPGPLAVLGERGEVALGDEREVGRGLDRALHVLGDQAPQSPHRHALLGLGGGGGRGGSGDRTARRLGGAPDVGGRDGAARAAARDPLERDPQLLREQPHRGCGGDPGGRHGYRRAGRRRTGRRRRSGGRRAWRGRRARGRPCRSRRCGRLAVHRDRDDRRPDRHHLPGLGEQGRDHPRARRGDLDARLVGHHLDQGLALGHALAGLDQPADDLALGDSLADVGQLELEGHARLPVRSSSRARSRA